MSPILAGRFFITEPAGKPLATCKVGKGEHFFLALLGPNREKLFFYFLKGSRGTRNLSRDSLDFLWDLAQKASIKDIKDANCSPPLSLAAMWLAWINTVEWVGKQDLGLAAWVQVQFYHVYLLVTLGKLLNFSVLWFLHCKLSP